VINIEAFGSMNRVRTNSNPALTTKAERDKLTFAGNSVAPRTRSIGPNPIGAILVKGADGKEYILIPVN
jgi:hypothetical protein